MQRWFLSYNSQDTALIEGLEASLRRKDADAQIFFAPKALRAGGYWLPALSEAIANSTAFVLIVGEKGLGPWQVIEYYEALDKRVKAPDFPLIFVLLEGQPAPGLPFLRQLHWTITPDPGSEETAARVLAATAEGESRPGELWRYTAPYRGLAAMTETDSDFFFGRSQETIEVLKTIQTMPDRLPLLLGNSGVGKSSLAQAGVLASLKRQAWPEGNETTGAWPAEFHDSRHWCYLKFSPGTEPLKALVESFLRTWQLETTDPVWEKRQKDWLEALLAGDATMRGLMDATERRYQELGQPSPPAFFLYIDQGEELYVRSEERQRRRFSELVSVGIGDPRLRAIMSLRSDFFGALQSDEPLYAAHRQINVPPLREAELREVVSRPAELLSAHFETPALATDMARRTAQESAKDAGALPLLSYLLDDMWTQMVKRGDGVLRVPAEAFELGGVLADRANAFLASHPKAEAQLRRILTLQLANVREDGEPTRRRALRSEFSDEDWRLVSELADHPHRLLVTAAPERGETYAEVAHEAIFRRWDRLREWMAAERDFLIWKSGLEAARRSWEQAAAPTRNDALLMGLALAQAQSWLVKRAEDLPKTDREFIDLSLQREALERRQRESLRRRVLVTAVVALAVVSVLAVFSLLQWRAAEQQRAEAVKQEQFAKDATTQAEEERHRAEAQRAEAIKQEQVAKVERARAEEQRAEAMKQEQAAQHERTRAEQALATATQIANTLVFDMMSNFRELGLPVELIDKMLDRAIQSYDQAIRLDPKGFATYNARGSAYWNKGDYDRAIADYDKAIEINPRYPYAYNNRGLAYSRKKDHDLAIADFEKAIEIDPKYASAYSGRASAYRDKGDYDRAIADYTKAVELNPRYALGYNSRGYTYSLRKDYDLAIADFSRAIKLDPKYAVAYLNRGLAYAGKSDYDRAIADYNQALIHNPKYAFAYNNRGLAYSRKKDPDRAIADYDQAIRLDPKYSTAYNNRGISHYNKQAYDRAIADYEKAIEINPKYALAYNNRGNAHSAKRDYERAIADYDKAIEIDPKYALAYNNRGYVHARKNDHDLAIADYDKAIEFDPKYVLAYNNRGLAYAAKDDHDRAILDYSEALKIDSEYVFAYRNRGRAYYEKGEHDRAIADYDKALELDPKSVSSYNTRGNAYFAKHDYDRAIADYEEAIKLDAKYAVARYNRGLAYANKGDYDRAIASYDEAIGIDPKYVSAYHNRGRAHHGKRNYERAIADFSEAIKLSPKLSSAFNDRGDAHSAAGNLDRAIADYDEAIKLNPRFVVAHGNRGDALRRKGDYDRAVASYDQAIALNAKYVAALNGRGFAQFSKGDFPAAAADFLRALEVRDDALTMLWRYLARARAGEDALAEFRASGERLKDKGWPYAVIEFYFGQRSMAELLAAAKDGDRCIAQFFLGQWHVLHRNHPQAVATLRSASQACPKASAQYEVALVELKRLNP